MSKTKGRKDSIQKDSVAQDIDENSDKAKVAIDTMRVLVQGEKNLRVRTDDTYLLRFLRCSGFDANKAFSRLQVLYKAKAAHPDWYACMPVPAHKTLLERHIQVVLPGRDRQGRCIYVVRNYNIDTSTATAQAVSQLDDLWFEAIADDVETQKNGVAVIMDMCEYPLRLLSWLTPGNIKAGTRKTESHPYHVVYHVVNTSMFMNAVVALIFPFLSANTKENIHFHHQDWDSLHKHIEPENLPTEYGGSQPCIDYEGQIKKLLFDQQDLIWEGLQMGYEVTK